VCSSDLRLIENCNIPRKRPSENRKQNHIKNENVRLQSALKCLRRRTSGTSCEHGRECVI
jgi:hypothetical protein